MKKNRNKKNKEILVKNNIEWRSFSIANRNADIIPYHLIRGFKK